MNALFILFVLVFPLLLIWQELKVKLIQWLSPIIICYATGIILANLPIIDLPKDIVTTISEVSVPLAIPLLLISTDIKRWLGGARGAIISFLLCVLSVTLVASVAAYFFRDQLPESWKLAGMAMGVYTGGTPNMSAIGLSLDVPEETFVLMNASDLILGAIYLLFLMTLAKPMLGYVLPKSVNDGSDAEDGDEKFIQLKLVDRIINVSLYTGIAIAILAVAIGLAILITGKMSAVVIILSVTTVGILLSFVSKIKSRVGSYELGEYFLLVFCLAMGCLADVAELIKTASETLLFMTFTMFGSIILHILLAAIFRIDRDTVIITSVAGIYGPAFVGPIAKVLNNKSVILTGMTTGLIGYAIGNYLGIGVAYLLENWIK